MRMVSGMVFISSRRSEDNACMSISRIYSEVRISGGRVSLEGKGFGLETAGR